MNDAIYYPSIRCSDHSLLASALFLWDSLSFIVPHKDMAGTTGDRETDEAIELVGKELVPSEHAKKEAAQEVRTLIEAARGGDIDLRLSSNQDERTYPIYPGKFEVELWDELVAEGVTAFDADNKKLSRNPSFGR